MQISEQWLREWANPALSAQQMAHQLTMAGLEVDALQAIAPPFNHVVVGEIIAIEQHPQADRGSDGWRHPPHAVLRHPRLHLW